MIEVPFAVIEGAHLARLVSDFRTLVEDADALDPAVSRLTPSPYPDDEAAAREFADGTRSALLERRLVDATTVAQTLLPFDLEDDALTEEDALAQRTVVIADAEIDAWLRTLTAIRLVLASRLGITDEEYDAADERFALYDWLGFRLEALIQAAESP